MRNYNDPDYKEFRLKVLARDNYTCQWPNCKSRKRCQVHHIMLWAKYPELRYSIKNGITLCKKHHNFIKGKEEEYAQILFQILQRK